MWSIWFQVMPSFEPGGTVDVFVLEHSVGDGQAVGCAEVQKPLAIITHRAWQAKAANAASPLVGMLANFGNEVGHEDEVMEGGGCRAGFAGAGCRKCALLWWMQSWWVHRSGRWSVGWLEF